MAAFLPRLTLSAWLLAAATSAAHGPAAPTGADAFGFYPLQILAGSRLALAAQINGHDAEVLLDSAAEMTLVDLKFAKRSGLVSAEQVLGRGSGQSSFEAQLVHGVALAAIGVRLPEQTVALVDLSDISRRLVGHPVQAILGRELFDAARLEIDIAQQRLRVLPVGSAARGTRLDLVSEHGVETIPVSIEGHPPVRATFDLGNGSHVLVSRAYAQQLNLLHDGRAVRRERGGGLGGETERDVLTLRSIELAGRSFTDVTAAIDAQDTASAVNVGVELLRHFTLITDFHGRAIWLLPQP
jgi:Aspartyl protease